MTGTVGLGEWSFGTAEEKAGLKIQKEGQGVQTGVWW